MSRVPIWESEPKHCEYCGERIILKNHGITARAWREKRRFCSRDCLSHARKFELVEFSCKYCGKQFKDWSYDNRIYCSRECQYASMRGPKKERKVFICNQCGQEFVSKRNWDKGLYCSRECYQESRNKPVAKQCQTCGKSIKVYHYQRERKKFCSQECVRKSRGFSQNKFEHFIESIHDSIAFVGDWSFWIRLPDGRSKNPDFLVRPYSITRTVIEAADISYWHTREEMLEIKQLYSEIGVNCILAFYQDWRQDSASFQESLLTKIEGVKRA